MVSAPRLLRALRASAAAHGCAADLTLAVTRDWASALFVGARYDIAAELGADEAGERWATALPEVELPMPGQFASEVRVTARGRDGARVRLTIEALVLED